MWNSLFRPLLFRLEPERAHGVSMGAYAALAKVPGVRGIISSAYRVDDPRLRVRLFDIDFPSPVGLAAGFDKNAEWFNALARLGFGFIEVGTITGQSQSGNPKPRLFRLPADRALINRFGFNSHGSAAVAAALARKTIRPVLGVNIGKSKVVPNDDAAADYLLSFERLYSFGKYFVVNVSSPNTVGLRALQQFDALSKLLEALANRNRELAQSTGVAPKPLLVKISPDLDESQMNDVVAICLDLGIAGIVATNTTINDWDRLKFPQDRLELMKGGGLSGKPLTIKSRAVVAKLYRNAQGKIPIIGVGGIMCGEDAWQMIRAGASLVQAYTGFIYGGPGFAKSVTTHLSHKVTESGKASIQDVVGEAAD